LKASGLGFLELLKFKIGLEAFKSWALIMGLKICKKIISLLIFFRPFGLCPILRPFGLGVLFSKKPEPDPPLQISN
jgi:hypothetical protein